MYVAAVESELIQVGQLRVLASWWVLHGPWLHPKMHRSGLLLFNGLERPLLLL